MKLISYQTEEKYIDEYSKLIRNIYNKYPVFAKTKIEEINKIFNEKNPFLKFGNWKNFLLFDTSKPIAHISTILDERLPINIGLVGYFDSLNKTEYAFKVFDAAIEFLSNHQKKIIKGPINITTWQSFRISYPETDPPFFTEPFTRSYYQELFKDYGFKIDQHNISTIQVMEKINFEKFESKFRNLKNDGFIFEAIDSKHFFSILPELHNLILEIFTGTYSFIKISLEEFVYYFETFSRIIDDCYLYIVRDPNKKAVAFLFGTPDFYSKTEKIVIFKTMGVLSKYQRLGIGHAMFYVAHLALKERFVSKVIFSTIRDGNMRIKRLTDFSQNVYREYSVFKLIL